MTVKLYCEGIIAMLIFVFLFQILINKNKQAWGVKYEKDGEIRVAKARREVVLCGGAINSPAILMHSGIGPRHHLEEVGVSATLKKKTRERERERVLMVWCCYATPDSSFLQAHSFPSLNQSLEELFA